MKIRSFATIFSLSSLRVLKIRSFATLGKFKKSMSSGECDFFILSEGMSSANIFLYTPWVVFSLSSLRAFLDKIDNKSKLEFGSLICSRHVVGDFAKSNIVVSGYQHMNKTEHTINSGAIPVAPSGPTRHGAYTLPVFTERPLLHRSQEQVQAALRGDASGVTFDSPRGLTGRRDSGRRW